MTRIVRADLGAHLQRSRGSGSRFENELGKVRLVLVAAALLFCNREQTVEGQVSLRRNCQRQGSRAANQESQPERFRQRCKQTARQSELSSIVYINRGQILARRLD
jgi:hypothetical protein